MGGGLCPLGLPSSAPPVSRPSFFQVRVRLLLAHKITVSGKHAHYWHMCARIHPIPHQYCKIVVVMDSGTRKPGLIFFRFWEAAKLKFNKDFQIFFVCCVGLLNFYSNSTTLCKCK